MSPVGPKPPMVAAVRDVSAIRCSRWMTVFRPCAPSDKAAPNLGATPGGRIVVAVQRLRNHAVTGKVDVAGRYAAIWIGLNNSGVGAAEILHRTVMGLCSTCRRSW